MARERVRILPASLGSRRCSGRARSPLRSRPLPSSSGCSGFERRWLPAAPDDAGRGQPSLARPRWASPLHPVQRLRAQPPRVSAAARLHSVGGGALVRARPPLPLVAVAAAAAAVAAVAVAALLASGSPCSKLPDSTCSAGSCFPPHSVRDPMQKARAPPAFGASRCWSRMLGGEW